MNVSTDMTAAYDAVLKDPCASRWLKGAVLASTLRDPVDALNDAEALACMCRRRVELVNELSRTINSQRGEAIG